MIEVTEEFGFNAGRVWKALERNGALTEHELMQETCLRENEVSAAVGWLARENKIRKDGDVYRLDKTNLTVEIGGNAGIIWNMLYDNGELDTDNLSRLTQKDQKNVFSALGWLAKENKIHLRKKPQLNELSEDSLPQTKHTS